MKGYTDLSQSKKLAGVEGNSRTIKIKVIMEQPKWCNYPDATTPTLGCWSLLDGLVKDESYCKDCDCYKPLNNSNMEQNPFFGWILKDNPNFWEDNGYKKIDSSNFHYYGCNIAKVNKHPVYRKHLYICHDMGDDSMVEVFSCDIGSVKHDYIVAIHTWNNAGGSKFPLNIAKQVSTIDSFNALISEYIGDELEDGTYLLKR